MLSASFGFRCVVLPRAPTPAVRAPVQSLPAAVPWSPSPWTIDVCKHMRACHHSTGRRNSGRGPCAGRDVRPPNVQSEQSTLCHASWCSDASAPTWDGSVTKKLLSSTASKAHGSSSWHGMDGEFEHRLHLFEDRATSLLLVSCTHRCSGQGCTETFLLRFQM